MGANAPLSQDLAQTNPPPLLAVIDESACIGCTLCLDPCPVDAIVGAQGFMHTVIEAECTGCELCIAPCPVDCISLLPKTIAPPTAPVALLGRGCINCGQCIEACPVKLQPDQLLKLSDANDWDQADSLRLQDCIECGLCDRVCPSEINLSARFTQAKRIAGELSAVEAEKQRIKARYQRHQERLIAVQNEVEDRRAQRLATRLAQRSAQGSAQQSTQDPSADR
jgi:Na+-translocating ferredoxin:NAD+ oxidoreductase RNF subunit RnfB